MIKIEIDRKELFEAIESNMASWNYYSTTGINEYGDILVDSQSIPCRNRGNYFIPLPSWNPEGSGHEIEEFNEFTSLQEHYPIYVDWQDENDGSIEDYLDAFPNLQDDWREWKDNQIDSLIDNWDINMNYDPNKASANYPYSDYEGFDVLFEILFTDKTNE